jgi:hypothetical protein
MTTIPDSVPTVNLDHDPGDAFAPSDEDARWAAQVFNATADDFDVEPDFADLDELAALEAAALDCLEAGLIPWETAESLMARSVIGHIELP